MTAMSARTIDINGWLTVEGNPITKAGVFPYLGSEIGAPNPDQIYYVYRPAEELQRPETIDSFKLIPFIDEHEMLGEDATPAERKGIQGLVGEKVYYDEPYIRGNLRILSDSARSLIDSGKIELSPGYRCRYDFTPGVFNGQQYDAIQRDIRANHLALVQEGRTGRDVSVQDHFIITIDTSELINMTLEELIAAIAALSDEDKQKVLSRLSPGEASDEDGEEEETKDADTVEVVEALEEVVAEAEAAIEEVESGTPAAAEEAVEAVAVAAEEAEEIASMDSMKKEIAALRKQLAAMDEATILKTIAARDKLATSVSRFIGAFDHSLMTASQVAEYGVKKLGIKCAKGHEAIALDAWMQGRKPESEQPSTAMDSRVNSTSVKSKLWGTK